MNNNTITIDLEKFKGKTSKDLKAHIEQILSNIKCVVKVPSRDGKGRLVNFRLTSNIDLNVNYKEYYLQDIINEN